MTHWCSAQPQVVQSTYLADNRGMSWATVKMAFFLLILPMGVRSALSQAPVVAISAAIWDFGVKDQGIREDYHVRVTNKGQGALLILEIGTTCGCIKTKMSSRRIEPGATADFIIHLDATRKTGRIEKSAWFTTNAPAQRRVTIDVKGTIRPSWWTSITTLNFGNVPLGSKTKRSFFVYTEPGRRIQLLKIESDQSFFVAKEIPFSDTNGASGWKIEIALDGSLKPGAFRANVTVHTDFENNRMQSVPIIGTIVGSVAVEPAQVAFGLIKVGQVSKRTLTLRNMGKTPLQILKINCPDKSLRSKLVVVKRGQQFRIELSYAPAQANPKPVRGSIWIKTSDPERRLIRVHYTARHP